MDRRWWTDLFREEPTARRRLVLLLYLIVGPVFTSVLVAVGSPLTRWAALPVVGLIAAGAVWLGVRGQPGRLDWVFPVAIVPTLCCGVAAYAAGAHGWAYFGVMGAPVAWAAVLFEAPVVWAAFATALVTCFTAISVREGVLDGALNALVFGTIVGLVGWVVHRQAQALRAAESERAVRAGRDRALLEAFPDTISRLDAEGRFLDVHGAPGAPLPARPEELVGRSVFELMPSDVVPRARSALRQALDSGTLTTLEYTTPYPDGPRTFEARIARSLAGEVVIIRRDVTDRERAAGDRRLLAGLVRGMAEGVIVADRELRIMEYTGRAEEIYGWTRQEAIGKSLIWDFTSEIVGGREEEVRLALAEGRDVRCQLRALRKDGAWIDLELSATALRDDAGQLIAWLSVARDIREAVARERALRESEERLRASERSLQTTVAELQDALAHVKRLSGLLPICMHCHKIRDDSGYWARVEAYIGERSDARFTHALCPECYQKYYTPAG